MAFRKSSDFSHKDSNDVVSADLNHVDPITQRKFKNSRLDGYEYFISLETMKNSNSNTRGETATSGGNLAFVFFGEVSQIGSNFGESEDLMDSPTSMNGNSSMADSTDMDEKFAMLEKTIESLKNSIDDKNLHIAQLMNKLETFTPRESSHVPTCPPGFDFDARNKDVEESLAKAVPLILDEFLAKKVIDLLESKRPEEINKVGDPKYCKFHRTLGHPTSKCFILKEKIMMLVSEGKIIINMDETAEANHASVASNQKKRSRSQIMPNTISLLFGSFTPVEIDFPRKIPEGSLEIDDNEADGWTLVTHKKRRHQTLLRIQLSKTRAPMSDVNQLQPLKTIQPCTNGKINGSLSRKASIKMSKKRTEEVSIRLSPSKGNMQTNIDNEQPIFRYIPRERQKKGQPLLEECTQQVHPPRKELSHITFQDLKEKIYVPIAQVPSITLEPFKGNAQVGKIKGNFDQNVFTLFEKSSYDFSNPVKLGELRDEVTGEKIHGLTKSQMQLRKKVKHRDELRSVFERIGRLTPRVSAFERLGRKDERESSKQVDGYSTTSKTSVFHRLGTKRKSSSERRLLEHKNQDFCDVTDNKEIHSVFPSHMKRKDILSVTTEGSLKVRKSTIVVTNQFHGETKKEEDEAITVFVRSQREVSNLIQSSYHITVEEGQHIDDTIDDVQEAPPQLEDGVQSTIDDLKELNLGTLEDPCPTFISALLTP
ncbi:hypothetical protein H5410_046977 [Solanum commersonii]|uniref:Retrotransposon gag protein n=1 Tax=Solanum commersonii TaxID=4109 RepID=A0A9J5XFX5_SOLCO|nr:hypothetical protein H5410_046977 [Solanum commersonii]